MEQTTSVYQVCVEFWTSLYPKDKFKMQAYLIQYRITYFFRIQQGLPQGPKGSTSQPMSPLRKQRNRKKLGSLPMTSITSLDMPTDEDDEMPEPLVQGMM